MRGWLVRLYPRAWRDRYGDEFQALLEQQSATVGRVADVVLGAIDAHLTANSPERRGWWLSRIPGLMIAFGALVWAVAFAIREAGVGQDVTNLASILAPMGEVVVGLGILALPPLWIGASRTARLANVCLGVAMLIGASYIHAVHVVGLASGPDYLDFERANVGFGLLFWAASILWATSMLARSWLPRVPLFALAVCSSVTLGMIWSGKFGYDFNPAVGRGFDIPTELAAAAWFVIGLSLLSRAPRSEIHAELAGIRNSAAPS
jgi:hypothetical protein